MSKYKRGSPEHNKWLRSRGITPTRVPSRTSAISVSSRISRILTDTRVETLSVSNVNGFEVSANRYNGRDGQMQVFIDDLLSDKTVSGCVSMEKLDEFIAQHTQRA